MCCSDFGKNYAKIKKILRLFSFINIIIRWRTTEYKTGKYFILFHTLKLVVLVSFKTFHKKFSHNPHLCINFAETQQNTIPHYVEFRPNAALTFRTAFPYVIHYVK